VPTPTDECELCTAALLTERYAEDELCWVAECESCFVPMVVWREHDPHPTDDVRAELIARLRRAVEQHFVIEDWTAEVRVDDHLRSIPDHYHAHARSRRGPGAPWARRTSSSPFR